MSIAEQLKDFNIRVDEKRKQGYTDSDILDVLSKRDSTLSDRISKTRDRYNVDKKITNDRDLINFMSQTFSGSAPTVRSIPLKEVPVKEKKRTLPKRGYLSSVFEEYKEAGEDIKSGIEESAKQIERGSRTGGVRGGLESAHGVLRGGLRTVGGVAGAAFAPITEAPVIKPALEFVGSKVAEIPGVSDIAKRAEELSIKYPEYAKDIKNIIDISILGTGKTVEKPVGTALERAGTAVEKTGAETIKKSKSQFSQELVKPISTKKVKLAEVSRTTETGGLFKKDIVTPTKTEMFIAAEVAKIPGISVKNTFQKNYNIIRDYNLKMAKELKSKVASNNFIIPKKEIKSKLRIASEELKNNPLIVGNAEKTAQKLIDGANRIIDRNAGTGSGILKARKEYDAWVLTQKPKAFDATAENAFTTANNTIRRTFNTILDEKAVNVGVKDSLKKQSSLYTAIENIAPKAALEANTVFGRTLQSVGKILGTKNKIVQGIAAAAGIGGLGAAATFAPAAAILGGAGFFVIKAGKFVLKPEIKILVGKLLKTSGRNLSSKDRSVLEKFMRDSISLPKR